MGTSKYTPEFRADAVALYRASPGRTYAPVAKDLGVNHETLRVWVREAEQAAVPGTAEATALARENRQLRTQGAFRPGAAGSVAPWSRGRRRRGLWPGSPGRGAHL
ncbi:transposase [Streptomyces sp. H27-C3]|uniref:transposase n=1 Tax=Streptomyces sp. H27-C3 TaxID=3046305 RepID=UPI0024BA3315|nr:transposase [Streptomyces sp. H27-C3]MDJ0467136.1 transposase [Streptomyces sp. H27-C3]